jgi:hypothetical protein
MKTLYESILSSTKSGKYSENVLHKLFDEWKSMDRGWRVNTPTRERDEQIKELKLDPNIISPLYGWDYIMFCNKRGEYAVRIFFSIINNERYVKMKFPSLFVEFDSNKRKMQNYIKRIGFKTIDDFNTWKNTITKNLMIEPDNNDKTSYTRKL